MRRRIAKSGMQIKIVNSKIGGAQKRIVKANILTKVVNSKIRGVDVDTVRFKYNQIPVEALDGSRTVFTLPNSDKFVSGLIEVFMNGNQSTKDVEWEETGTTQITLLGVLAADPPSSDEKLRFHYIKQ